MWRDDVHRGGAADSLWAEAEMCRRLALSISLDADRARMLAMAERIEARALEAEGRAGEGEAPARRAAPGHHSAGWSACATSR